MPLDRANVVIIGGGVVGCAIACELSAHTADVFLLEQLPRLLSDFRVIENLGETPS